MDRMNMIGIQEIWKKPIENKLNSAHTRLLANAYNAPHLYFL